MLGALGLLCAADARSRLARPCGWRSRRTARPWSTRSRRPRATCARRSCSRATWAARVPRAVPERLLRAADAAAADADDDDPLARWWRVDLPELDDLDTSAAARARARARRAGARGGRLRARRTWFLANGSTAGVVAAVVACVRRHGAAAGARARAPLVALPRNAHRSRRSRRSSSRARSRSTSSPRGSTASSTATRPATRPAARRARRRCAAASTSRARRRRRSSAAGGAPRVACVLLVSGTASSPTSPRPRARARARGVPLVVDAAHGAHLRFVAPLACDAASDGGVGGGRGRRRRRRRRRRRTAGAGCALAGGADVVVQSTHKTLCALSQAACSTSARRAHAGELEPLVAGSLGFVLNVEPVGAVARVALDAARWDVAAPPAAARAAAPRSPRPRGSPRARATRSTRSAAPPRAPHRRERRARCGPRARARARGLPRPRAPFAALDPLRVTMLVDARAGSGVDARDVDAYITAEHGVYCDIALLSGDEARAPLLLQWPYCVAEPRRDHVRVRAGRAGQRSSRCAPRSRRPRRARRRAARAQYAARSPPTPARGRGAAAARRRAPARRSARRRRGVRRGFSRMHPPRREPPATVGCRARVVVLRADQLVGADATATRGAGVGRDGVRVPRPARPALVPGRSDCRRRLASCSMRARFDTQGGDADRLHPTRRSRGSSSSRRAPPRRAGAKAHARRVDDEPRAPETRG